MTYTQVFGGTTIYPSDVSYLAIALSADEALEWPLESNDPANPASRIIDVTTSGSYSITLPDATLTGAGQTILFNNLAASTNSFLVKDYAGNTIATVGIGEQWQVYLANTSTAAGTWRVFRYGASTATVQASALAGYGITVTSNTLSQATPVTTFNSSPRTVLDTDRARMLTWTGTGAATVNLPSAVSVGNNFFVSVRNSGGGDVTIDPAGSETIDDLATLALRPGNSATLITDGLTWYSLGLGQEAVFAFDYTSISVTGGTYTLAGSELNRIAYQFVGTLTSDQYIVVPATIQQYWVDNATTGSYAFYLQTSGGTPVAVTQGARGIYYCNGSQVVDADTATISLPISAANGGTGITSYSIGDLIYASGATTLAKLSDVAVGNALISGGVGVAPSWGKIVLTTHVSGTLPVANGGTGAATLTGYVKGNGTSAMTAAATVPTSDLSGTVAVANGGTALSSTPTNGQLLIGNGTNYTLATITAGSGVSVTNGAGTITIAATGTGLTNWTEGVNTSSPNATVPVVYFNATNAATNVDAAIVPKGTGALALAVADSTATGGNKRGANAVDLQTSRANATEVASGSISFLAGSASTASGSASVCIARSSSATAGDSAVVGGVANTASGSNSIVLGGSYGTTRSAYGLAHGGNPIANTAGASQFRRFILGRQTTDTTATVLTANTSAAAATNQVNLANNSAFFFRGSVIANVTGGGNTKGWTIEGVIKRGANAASTAMVGTATVTSSYADAGASTWSVAVSADTTNGCLAVTVTGQASTTIRWVASIETTEVTF